MKKDLWQLGLFIVGVSTLYLAATMNVPEYLYLVPLGIGVFLYILQGRTETLFPIGNPFWVLTPFGVIFLGVLHEWIFAILLLYSYVFSCGIAQYVLMRWSTNANSAFFGDVRAVRARRENGPVVDIIPSEKLREGDIIEIHEGDIVPSDVRIMEGSADVDLKTFTGSTQIVTRSVGEDLYMGSILLSGETIRAEVLQPSGQSIIWRIEKHAVRLQKQLSPFFNLLLRYYAGVFLLVLVLLAALTFFLTLSASSFILLAILGNPISILTLIRGYDAIARRKTLTSGVYADSQFVFHDLRNAHQFVLDPSALSLFVRSKTHIVWKEKLSTNKIWSFIAVTMKYQDSPRERIIYREAVRHVQVPGEASKYRRLGKDTVFAKTSQGEVVMGPFESMRSQNIRVPRDAKKIYDARSDAETLFVAINDKVIAVVGIDQSLNTSLDAQLGRALNTANTDMVVHAPLDDGHIKSIQIDDVRDVTHKNRVHVRLDALKSTFLPGIHAVGDNLLLVCNEKHPTLIGTGIETIPHLTYGVSSMLRERNTLLVLYGLLAATFLLIGSIQCVPSTFLLIAASLLPSLWLFGVYLFQSIMHNHERYGHTK